MERIGILGGTFNPIHIGHLAMAEVARDRCALDRVIFVPCSLPPHKNIKNLVEARDRLRMVRLAVRDNPCFQVSDFEMRQGGKSYTVNTVRHFRETLPRTSRLFFIVGGDNLQELSTWKAIDEILKAVTFIVVNRPSHGPDTGITSAIRHLPVRMPGIDVSASYIRTCIQKGQSVRYFVPDRVLNYIKEQRLYQKP